MWLRYQNVQTGNPDMLNLDLIEEIGITEDSELIDHYAIAAYTQGSDDPLILFRSPSYSEVAERIRPGGRVRGGTSSLKKIEGRFGRRRQKGSGREPGPTEDEVEPGRREQERDRCDVATSQRTVAKRDTSRRPVTPEVDGQAEDVRLAERVRDQRHDDRREGPDDTPYPLSRVVTARQLEPPGSVALRAGRLGMNRSAIRKINA